MNDLNETKVDLSKFKNRLGLKNQLYRALWNTVWFVFARPIPRGFGCGWKRFLLRLFGAQMTDTSYVYSSAKIYNPSFLKMGKNTCIDGNVNFYNVDMVTIGDNTTISQGAFISPGSHDITDPLNPMISKPIIIEDQVWIAADAFIGYGVHIGQGAVVGARAAVFKDVEPWTIVGGNPAKILKKRVIKDA